MRFFFKSVFIVKNQVLMINKLYSDHVLRTVLYVIFVIAEKYTEPFM